MIWAKFCVANLIVTFAALADLLLMCSNKLSPQGCDVVHG